MKTSLALLAITSLFAIATYAVEPGPTPDAAEKEKVSEIIDQGGALKVQKEPAVLEDLPVTEEEKAAYEKNKNKKKNQKKNKDKK